MAGRLNARRVETLTEPGRHADGGGLYLFLSANGGRRWIFMFKRSGRRTEMGLGSAGPDGVSLKDARLAAAEARRLLQTGVDPLEARRAAEREAEKAARVVPTFGQYADEYIAAHKGKFRNAKHVAQWEMTLGDSYCKPIRRKPIDAITTEDILRVLQPVWQRVPETASRLRGRLENVLAAATAAGLREGANPAQWRGHLQALLPARGRLTRGHHAALAYDALPGFVSALRARQGLAGVALEFTILCAARTSEALCARWEEIDLERGVWTIPGPRMKAGRVHRVPLSARAVELLRALPRENGSEFVFPGFRRGRPLSNMAMTMVLRAMDRGDVTVHGMRSAFRDWCAEQTSFPREVCEAALAHVNSDRTEAAYFRSDLFERRRALMEAWAAFIEPRADDKVVRLRSTGA